MKLQFEAIDPAGKVHSRVSETMVFTHIVVVLPNPDHDPIRVPGYFERWQNLGWCRSGESALRLSETQKLRNYFADVRVAAVTQTEAL